MEFILLDLVSLVLCTLMYQCTNVVRMFQNVERGLTPPQTQNDQDDMHIEVSFWSFCVRQSCHLDNPFVLVTSMHCNPPN